MYYLFLLISLCAWYETTKLRLMFLKCNLISSKVHLGYSTTGVAGVITTVIHCYDHSLHYTFMHVLPGIGYVLYKAFDNYNT